EMVAVGRVLAEQSSEGRERTAERDEARGRRDVAGDDTRQARAAERDQDRTDERREQADPGTRDHPLRLFSRSTSRGTLRRFNATTRPSPTTTSDAATAITAIANTCPSARPR